ncbi:unnamed protein product, partial [Candidula unifasciata]
YLFNYKVFTEFLYSILSNVLVTVSWDPMSADGCFKLVLIVVEVKPGCVGLGFHS